MQENELRAALALRGVNNWKKMSDDTSIPYSTLLRKIYTGTFDQGDIRKIIDTYSLSDSEAMGIFFSPEKVE